MKTIQINQITLGEGIPKICIPIVGTTKEDILQQAKKIASTDADLIEWRADWYEDVKNIDQVCSLGQDLHRLLAPIPLLFTFRTAAEGGNCEITTQEYRELYEQVLESRFAELIDVELYFDQALAKKLIAHAHRNNLFVIASNHDFQKTPPKDEIIKRLLNMQNIDADIPKIAVMPNSKQDVLTLLDATLTMQEQYADRPIITMSMGAQGSISRFLGEFTGSALTFGSLEKSSAPGQIPLYELFNALKFVHNSLIQI